MLMKVHLNMDFTKKILFITKIKDKNLSYANYMIYICMTTEESNKTLFLTQHNYDSKRINSTVRGNEP